ncbi:DUF499 domain-containing protein [Micrococcus luteus]|uniref:Swt1 family HEPN domain-containing protein n=1 Tax=Micrococcus luteus TaxID=1270 RepID=UPI001C24AD24|nr:Swt1 family HEPN domain-containing protein [Micrococcus luteus]MBU8649651.1 DUF499 domain-containing protein [Micrococcus luteus]
MATSNREHVDTALGVLAGVLDPFIAKVLMTKLPAGAKDWTVVLTAKDAENGRTGAIHERTDPQSQFRVLTESLPGLGYAFNGVLSRTEQGYAGELREVRNAVAHHKPFTADQARRALETVELLLRAVGAAPEADRVRLIRREIERAEFEKETRQATRARSTLVRTDDTGLRPWREVLRPHPDVRSGDFASAEFAADLYRVAVKDTRGAADEPATEYTDAVEFFRRTYLTEGLRELLQRAAARLAGDRNADAVINLQTTFGGGKTHSMLAVWHLFSGRPLHEFPQDVQDVLAGHHDEAVGAPIRRVTIVGNEISPGQPVTKPDGTVVSTLWGEIAWQLGDATGDGAAAYAHVADADRSGTNPGGALRDLFAAYGPAVILIDEWVAYARQLNTHRIDEDGTRSPLPAGDFETQFTFAQALTQAAAAVPGILLLVSIPASTRREDGTEDDVSHASDLEVGGDFGHEALSRLDNVVRRVAYQWAPAARDESYEIVRRRLFEQPTADQLEQIAATARTFREFYRRHPGEFPSNVLDGAYEARIRASYPVHPELLDRLYAEWSTLEKFQRTRGVLRLMSTVVHQLWTAEDPSPLITAGTVPLDSAVVRRELVQYLPHGWDPVVQNDVDGDESVARRVDRERPNLGNRSLTVRVSRAVLIESAPTVTTTHKGVPRKQLLLSLAMPKDVVGNVSSALNALHDASSYFYSADDRFWYDTQPSLNRAAADRARQLDIGLVWDEVVARLKRSSPRNTPEFGAVVVAPRSTADVPEDDSVRLVVLHPEHLHQAKDTSSPATEFSRQLLTSRGSSARAMPNTLIMLAGDAGRWKDLESTVRSHLAWRSIHEERTALDLTPTNEAQAQRQVETTNRTIEDQITATWIWGLHAVQPDPRLPFDVAHVKCDGQMKKSLAERTGGKFVKEDLLRVESAGALVRMDVQEFLLPRWNSGHIRFGELWDIHTRFPYMSRLRDRDVLAKAVASVLYDAAFMQQGFALATGYDEETGLYSGLAVPLEDLEFGEILDGTLLVRPDLAVAQRERERRHRSETPTGAPGQSPGVQPSPTGGPSPAGPGGAPRPETQTSAARTVSNARYSGRVEIAGDADLSSTFQTLIDEVLSHLQNADPDTLEILVEVQAEKFSGFSTATSRTVGENARQLGFIKTHFLDG